MSRTIFRGTTLDGADVHQVQVYTVNGRIVIAVADETGRIIDLAALNLDMADGLGSHLRHRVLDARMEQEAQP